MPRCLIMITPKKTFSTKTFLRTGERKWQRQNVRPSRTWRSVASKRCMLILCRYTSAFFILLHVFGCRRAFMSSCTLPACKEYEWDSWFWLRKLKTWQKCVQGINFTVLGLLRARCCWHYFVVWGRDERKLYLAGDRFSQNSAIIFHLNERWKAMFSTLWCSINPFTPELKKSILPTF